MSTETEETEIVKRDIGERVDVIMTIEPSTLKDLGDGAFTATVTTSDVDRMGESIDTQGINTDTYVQTGGPVLYGHDYQGLPIGKTTKLAQFKNKLVATFQLATKEYPFAQTVADMIKGGYLNAVSIGGVVKQWNETYTVIEAMEMVEFSVVPVPANPNAIITARSFEKATGKSAEQVATEFHEFVEKSMSEKLKSLDNDELLRHIDTLKALLAILEATATKEAETSQEKRVIKVTLRKSANEMAQTTQKIIHITKAKE